MYTIISRENCTNCERIKEMLSEKGVEFKSEMLDDISKVDKFNYMNEAKKAGQMSLPIILEDGVFVPTVEVENKYNK